MRKEFVLVGITAGDELVPSREVLIAAAKTRAELELVSAIRYQNRCHWLETNELPWFQKSAMFVRDEIREVPRI